MQGIGHSALVPRGRFNSPINHVSEQTKRRKVHEAFVDLKRSQEVALGQPSMNRVSDISHLQSQLDGLILCKTSGLLHTSSHLGGSIEHGEEFGDDIDDGNKPDGRGVHRCESICDADEEDAFDRSRKGGEIESSCVIFLPC